MRVWLAAALLLLGTPGAAAAPSRVMSLNLCTDELVLALLPPARIAAVSREARDPAFSPFVAAARRVPVTRGSAEDVLAAHPDLVLAGSYTTPATRALLGRLGRRFVAVPPAETIAGIRASTRAVARALGEPARGEALLMRMDAGIAALRRNPGPAVRVAAWDGGGFGAPRGSLFDTLITLTGAINVGADRASRPGAALDGEMLLARAPALILAGGGSDDRDALRSAIARGPLLRRFWGEGRIIAIAPADYACGTPWIADAALRLRARLAAAPHAPLPFAPGLR
ncbi:MAG: ABC transporter substrate-binding protein [Sphingomonadales bacterium]|nr:ABC transporter substrate-binding protein [Sphingomonadales bacterium]